MEKPGSGLASSVNEKLAAARLEQEQRDLYVERMGVTLRGIVHGAVPLQPFTHGTIFEQMLWELNSIRIEMGDSLAANRRLRNKVKRPKRLKIYKRDNFTCQRCGWRPEKRTDATIPQHRRPGNHLTIDHRLPVTYGGDLSLENLETVCALCNQEKGKKLPDE